MTTKDNTTPNPPPDGLPEEWHKLWGGSYYGSLRPLLKAFASERKARLEAEAELAERMANPLLCVSSAPGAHDQEPCAGCEPCQLRAKVAQLIKERDGARAELAATVDSYEHACSTIAAMHAAAVGKVTGPGRGVVEDVADVAADNTRLRELLREARGCDLTDPADPLNARIDAELAKSGGKKERK